MKEMVKGNPPRHKAKAARCWSIHTDGAIRPEQGISGLAAVVRDETDKILYWWSKKAGPMTCNEAEYAAVIFAIEQLLKLPIKQRPNTVFIYSDSRIVVDQMTGQADAHAPALQASRRKVQTLARKFGSVSYQHISREQNRLSDALAFEVVSDWRAASHKKNRIKQKQEHENAIWEEFTSSWRKT
jgi:ribonuclease HI